MSDLLQVPCDGAYSIYDLMHGLEMRGLAVVQLLKPDTVAHLSPMELQVVCGKKMTFGVTDRCVAKLVSMIGKKLHQIYPL